VTIYQEMPHPLASLTKPHFVHCAHCGSLRWLLDVDEGEPLLIRTGGDCSPITVASVQLTPVVTRTVVGEASPPAHDGLRGRTHAESQPMALPAGTVLTNGGLCAIADTCVDEPALYRVKLEVPAGAHLQRNTCTGPFVVRDGASSSRVPIDVQSSAASDILPADPEPTPLPALADMVSGMLQEDRLTPTLDAVFHGALLRRQLPCCDGCIITLSGDRGYGKSTLVSALGRHYEKTAGVAFRCFSARRLAGKRAEAVYAALEAEMAWAVQHQPAILALDDLSAICGGSDKVRAALLPLRASVRACMHTCVCACMRTCLHLCMPACTCLRG